MIRIRHGRRAAAALLLLALAASAASAQGTLAEAPGGVPGGATADASITASEIEQRTLLRRLTGNVAPRDLVIEELQAEQLTIAQAKQRGVPVTDAEVEAAYSRLAARMGMTAAQLTEELGQGGVRAFTLKQRLRGDLARERLNK